MQKTVGILFLFMISCSLEPPSDWPEFPQNQGVWDFVSLFGGTSEDIAHAVIATQDGGYAILGNTSSSDGDFDFKNTTDSDIFLLKFSASHQLQWKQTYGGTDDDRGHGLIELSEGGFALVGYSRSSDGDASNNQGQHDNWVLVVDAQGALMWERSYGFAGHDHAFNIIETADGNLFFNGYLDVTASNGLGNEKKLNASSTRHGVGEFWCHKIDKKGQILWRRYFGGTNNDRSYDAIETSDGNFLLVGVSESQDVDISSPHGSYDIWVVKMDQNGTLLWEKSIGGSGYDIAYSVLENQDGNYMLLGQSDSTNGDVQRTLGNSDFLLTTLTPGGKIIRMNNLGTTAFDSGQALLQTSTAALFAVGHTADRDGTPLANDLLLLRCHRQGDALAEYRLSGSGLEIGYDLAVLKDGSLLVVGESSSNDGDFSGAHGDKDILLAHWY